MNYKWIGAVFIFLSCGGTGFSMALNHKREEAMLGEMESAISFMRSQLEFRLTPLPQLCRQAGSQSRGAVKSVFLRLSEELEGQLLPEASDCMNFALKAHPDLPRSLGFLFRELGKSLGQLDLSGQLRGLDQVKELCRRKQIQMEHNRDQRLRSYQTLSLCAGAALAILLL